MRRMVVVTAVVMLGAFAGAARAGHELTAADLAAEAAKNKALARYLAHNGNPDVAETNTIFDQPPWEDYEVTIFYLEHHKEIAFARARVLGRPQVDAKRYERTLTDAEVAQLRTRPGLGAAPTASPTASADTSASCAGSATERAKCAAERAEHAADRVDAAATQAEHAAERTEAVVEKMAMRTAQR